MNGKGDTPRPKAIPEDQYAERWTRTFCPPLRDAVPADEQPGLDARERLRQRNLADARRVILGTPCADWPARETLPTTDPED